MKKSLAFLAISLFLVTNFAEAKRAKPCKAVIKACRQAGFTKKTHVDCVLPIVAGKSLEGVSVTPEDVSACGKNIEKRKAKRAELKKEANAKRTESHQDPQ